MDSGNLRSAARGLLNNMKMSLPILASVLLLASLVNNYVSKEFFASLFSGGVLDPIIGAFFGSVAAGNPITSYIIGGELLSNGVSLVAVVAFVVSWVTVGVVQFPAESLMLGKRFAVVRNCISFIMAIMIALLAVLIIRIL